MEAELRQHPKGLQARLEDHCVIGRSPEADIQVFSSRVSREHAMIRRQSNGFWIYDLDSSNGTRINEQDISQPVQLKHGDVITMADITLIFHVPEQANGDGMELSIEPPSATVIGMKTQPMILLVTDIFGFSEFSQQLSENELAMVLNAWYEETRALMEKHRGQVDKFMGDGMFGYWRFITPQARAQALSTARELVKGPQGLSPDIQQMLQERGLSIRCGVGLHVGEAALGAVARGTRTALGDAVNLAFRIESLTRQLPDYPILASRDFVRGWESGQSAFVSCGSHEIKGVATPIDVYGARMDS